MTQKASKAPATSPLAASETEQQRFERILSRPEFKPLKAVFDNLGVSFFAMQGAIIATNSYQLFLGKVGYRVVIDHHRQLR